MLNQDILKKYSRNLEVEQYAKEEFLKKTTGFINGEDISRVMRLNKYNGLYLFEPEDFYATEDKEYVSGLYNHDSRVIILNKEDFNKWNDIAVHEYVHAFLNRRNQKRVKMYGIEADYGMGLEEGAASIIQKVDSIKDIDNCEVDSYVIQSFILKQLNTLYEYSDYKKYPNLIHHLLREPKDFLRAIAGTYESIFIKVFGNNSETLDLSFRCAYLNVSVTDAMTDDETIDYGNFCSLASTCNSICLALADEDARDGRIQNELFPQLSKVMKTPEERLLTRIFDNEGSYFENQKETLKKILILCLEEMERIKTDSKKDYTCKVKRK